MRKRRKEEPPEVYHPNKLKYRVGRLKYHGFTLEEIQKMVEEYYKSSEPKLNEKKDAGE